MRFSSHSSALSALLTIAPIASCLDRRQEPANATLSTNATLEYQEVYQFPPPTWIENVAVRPNGALLPIRTFNSPLLVQVDPATGESHLVHDFSEAGNSIQGITEVVPDFFAVDVLTCNITALDCTNGSVSTWAVDFRQPRSRTYEDCQNATVRYVTDHPNAGFLNGMAALNDHVVLIADSFYGGIWTVDMYTGEKELIFTDDALRPLAAASTGVNGIRVRYGTLYFTNSQQAVFGKLPIDPKTGQKTGNATIIADGLLGPDDFEVDEAEGVAYVANGAANQLLKIALNGSFVEVVASIPGPTSARWGPSQHKHSTANQDRILYVTNVGGLAQYVAHNITVGGAIDQLRIPH